LRDGERVLICDRTVDMRLGGEVDDEVSAVDGLAHGRAVLDRAFYELDPVGDLLEVLPASGVGQLVEDNDLVVWPCLEHHAHVGRADEARATGYQDPAHRIVMSEPSPTTNLNTRGSASVREIETERPISEASTRPGRSRI